jgi:hypothetical protein
MDDSDELPPPAAAGLKRERADRAVTEQTSGGKRSKTQLHGDGSQHKAALRAACCGDLRALRQLPLEALLHVGNHGVTPMVLVAKHGHGEWIRALAGVQSQPPRVVGRARPGRAHQDGLEPRPRRRCQRPPGRAASAARAGRQPGQPNWVAQEGRQTAAPVANRLRRGDQGTHACRRRGDAWAPMLSARPGRARSRRHRSVWPEGKPHG